MGTSLDITGRGVGTVLFGATPDGIDHVIALRSDGLLIVLIPVGMLMQDAVTELIELASVDELDAIRELDGGKAASLHGTRWSPAMIPEGHSIAPEVDPEPLTRERIAAWFDPRVAMFLAVLCTLVGQTAVVLPVGAAGGVTAVIRVVLAALAARNVVTTPDDARLAFELAPVRL